MSKTNLIFGITGQTGSYLAHYCISRGERVIGASRSPFKEFHKRNLYTLGIQDIQLLSYNDQSVESIATLIDNVEPTHVYYLSGQSSVGKSFQLPAETMHSVYIVVQHILEHIRLYHPQTRFFNSGSSEVFGNRSPDSPATELSLHNPKSPYGIAKSNAIQLTTFYRSTYNLFTVSGIMSNHESILRPPQFVLSKVLQGVSDIKAMHSSYLELGNIDVVRDWGWAHEYAQAIYLILNHYKPSNYIIATGKSVSLRSLVEQILLKSELDIFKHISINKQQERPLELFESHLDASKIESELGWTASVHSNILVDKLLSGDLF